MGTDIHHIFQKRTENGWIDIPDLYEGDRHYFLFACLANVRNGFGFAGVKTHKPVVPMSDPRGLPVDFDHEDCIHRVTDPEVLTKWESDPSDHDCGTRWMGDHSFTWLTADEILAYRLPGSFATGIITIDQYREWDGRRPSSYCGGIGGDDASAPAYVNDKTRYVSVTWPVEDDAIAYFVDEVRRLKELHAPAEVRFVCGFDS